MIKADLKLFSYGSRRDRERMIRQRETVTLQGYDRAWRRLGFSLVEILIVVAIIGILAAIVIPEFQQQAQLAKESAAKENLQILRAAIERYAIKNNDIAPGYPGNNRMAPALEAAFTNSMLREQYIIAMPENPFNNEPNILVLKDNEDFPNLPTGSYGWIYKPRTKTIKLNWAGKDSSGKAYYDY